MDKLVLTSYTFFLLSLMNMFACQPNFLSNICLYLVSQPSRLRFVAYYCNNLARTKRDEVIVHLVYHELNVDLWVKLVEQRAPLSILEGE